MVQTKHCIIINNEIIIPYVTHTQIISTQAIDWIATNPHITEIQYTLYQPNKKITGNKTEQTIIDIIQEEYDYIIQTWDEDQSKGTIELCKPKQNNTIEFDIWIKLWSQTTKQNNWDNQLLLNKIK
jgi:hypothetical protein